MFTIVPGKRHIAKNPYLAPANSPTSGWRGGPVMARAHGLSLSAFHSKRRSDGISGLLREAYMPDGKTLTGNPEPPGDCAKRTCQTARRNSDSQEFRRTQKDTNLRVLVDSIQSLKYD